MKTFSKIFTAACLFASLPGLAADLKGVHMPEQISVQGKPLYLNGMGARQKSVFHVDVYVAGLYLEAPSRDASAILNSNAIKKLVLVFLRDASAKQVVESWNEGIQEHCGSHCSSISSNLQHFDSLMTEVHRGQEVRLTFFPGRMTISSGERTEEIKGSDFAEIALASFIGPKDHADNVREALLSGRVPVSAQRLSEQHGSSRG